MLKDIGDNKLLPVKKVYGTASKVNIGSYMIMYPIMFGKFSE